MGLNTYADIPGFIISLVPPLPWTSFYEEPLIGALSISSQGSALRIGHYFSLMLVYQGG